VRKLPAVVFFLSLIAASVAAEEKATSPQPVAAPLALSLSWKVGAEFPLLDSQSVFKSGSPLVGIVADLPLPLGFHQLPNLIFSARGGVDWGFFSRTISFLLPPRQPYLSWPFFVTMGLGTRYNLVRWFGLSGDAQLGYYLATTAFDSGADITQMGLGFRVGAEADFGFESGGWYTSLGLRGEYANLLGLWQGLTGSVVLGFHAPVYDSPKEGFLPESPVVPGQAPSPTASQARATASDSYFSLQFTPAFGYTVVNLYPGQDTSYLSLIREDIKLSALYTLPSFPFLRLRADVAVKSNFSTDTFLYGDIGLGLGVRFLKNWDASIFVCEGIASSYAPLALSASILNLLVTSVGIDLSYSFSPTYSVGIEAMLNWINDRYGEVSTGVSMAYHFPSGSKPVAKEKPAAKPETQPPAEKPQLLQKPAEQEVPQPEPKETAIAQAAPKQEPAPAKVVAAEQPKATVPTQQPAAKAAAPEQKSVAKAEAAPSEQMVAAKPQPAPVQQPQKAEPQKPVEERGKGLAIRDLAIGNIFPIFHTFYDDHPIGKLTLKNTEYSSVADVTVSMIIRQYMDAPKECASIRELKAGEERSIDLFALFKNTILDITQATKVAAEITVSYTLNGKPATASKVETIRIYDRNAMTWDDDRKAAAFVTPKEPAVLIFSNNVNAALKGKMNRAVDKNLQMAIALHDALRLYGITYVSNPLTPYAVTSQDKAIVDTLKFPRQTFEYRSGDCSDLSILYSALMESVQIETAFITIPGHIFMAFALQATPDEIRKSFSQTDELIFRNEKVWVPVEVTEREKTFLDAWQLGAKEWRENLSKNQAGFFPVRDAWAVYEPVGLPGSGNAPVLPDQAQMVKDFRDDVARLVDREIFNKVAALQAAITKSQDSPKSINALGVLYARYDLTEKAEREFKKVTVKSEYVPALVNLGNLAFLKGDMEGALTFFNRAYKKDSKYPGALLGIARASHEIENYATVKKSFGELRQVDPDLASRFAYLELKGEEATRAADILQVRDFIIWQE
jgi:tetratricopeptide (TPR) repeat protein